MNASDENKWRHQYFLYVLNEENDVIPLMFPTNQDGDSCREHLRIVDQVLRKTERVKLCARGEFKKDAENDVSEDSFVDFGDRGKHKINYQALTFDRVCSQSDCYGISEMWTQTCPDLW